jgi:hypothetical protein
VPSYAAAAIITATSTDTTPMTSRPPIFRNNDPQFKHQEMANIDTTIKLALNRTCRSLCFLLVCRMILQEFKKQQPNAGASNNPVDPFGRRRDDWKEQPTGHSIPNTPPRSSPVKQKQIKTLLEQRRPLNVVLGSRDKALVVPKCTKARSLWQKGYQTTFIRRATSLVAV